MIPRHWARRSPAASPVGATAPTLGETVALVLGCLLAVGLAMWLTAGIWRGGVPTGDDTVAHLVRTRTALRLFAAGRADGWQTDFGLGYQQFLFMGSTFAAAVALVKTFGLGMVSTLAACKVVIVIAYGLLPVSVAVLALAAGLGRRAAGIAALLSLSVNSGPSGIGIDAVFTNGLVVHQFAVVLVFLSLASIAAVIRRPTRGRAALAGGSFAALILTHAIAALIAATLGGALALGAAAEWALRSCLARGWRRPRRSPAWRFRPGWASLEPGTRRLGALAGAAVLAFGLAAAVVVPVAAHGELRGPTTHYATDRLFRTLREVWHGRLLVRPRVAPLLAFALASSLLSWRRRGPLSLALPATPIVYLALTRLYLAWRPESTAAYQFGVRSYGAVAMFAVLALASTLAGLSSAAGRGATRLARLVSRRPRRRRIAATAATAALSVVAPLVAALAIVLLPSGLGRARATTVSPSSAMVTAAAVLEREVPVTGRFVTQRLPFSVDEGALTGVTNPDFWFPWASDRDTLTIYNVESSTVPDAGYEGAHLGDRAPEAESAVLARYGVTHVVILDVTSLPDLVSSSAFEVVWRQGDLAVLRVVPDEGSPPPQSLVSVGPLVPRSTATLERTDDEHLVFTIETAAATTASLAVAWSPKWHASLDGVAARTDKTPDGLLSIDLPAGLHRVELVYRHDRWDQAGRAVTGLTVALWATRTLWPGRRRSTMAVGSSAPIGRHRAEEPAPAGNGANGGRPSVVVGQVRPGPQRGL